jgi:hypothetical protein
MNITAHGGGTLRRPAAALLLLVLAAADPASAQQPAVVVSALLPDSVAERVVAFYNRAATTRLTGDARIGPAAGMRGDLAVLAGGLVVEGDVEGDVVVINGDLVVRPGGRIGGVATVVGGDVRVAAGGLIMGGGRAFREPLRFRYQGERIAYVPAALERGLAAGVDLPFGRTDIVVATAGAYNRVEGLAIAAGPRIRFAGTYPTTGSALITVRTAAASELDPRRLGYNISAEQVAWPAAGLTLGLRAYSEVTPLESWGVSNRESGLSAFLLHRDLRDHYQRDGWSVYGRLDRPGSALAMDIAFRDEEHASRAPANPFTVMDNGGPWRAQPSIAEGDLRSISAGATYDTRNEHRDPSAGWLVRVELEQGLGGSLENQAVASAPAPQDGVPIEARTRFFTTHLDVRRYARLSPYARLGVRILGTGSLDGRALPAQRQRTLGGEGSLPGYRLFEFDCGARTQLVDLRGREFYPYYGCDRVALMQVEYQANFPFARRLAEAAGLSASVGHLVRWVAFFDAGRAWTEAAAREGRLGGDDDFSADAGLGVRVGPLGIYGAVPLSGRGHGFNVFLRIGPRI